MQVERGSHLDWQQGFTPQHWLQTAAIVTMMCVSGAGAWVLMQLYTEPGIRMLALGGALLVIYVSIRYEVIVFQIIFSSLRYFFMVIMS